MAPCLFSEFERREMMENHASPLPAHWRVVFKKAGSRGMAGEGAAAPAACPCVAPHFPGLNSLYCFLAGEEAGSG